MMWLISFSNGNHSCCQPSLACGITDLQWPSLGTYTSSLCFNVTSPWQGTTIYHQGDCKHKHRCLF